MAATVPIDTERERDAHALLKDLLATSCAKGERTASSPWRSHNEDGGHGPPYAARQQFGKA